MSAVAIISPLLTSSFDHRDGSDRLLACADNGYDFDAEGDVAVRRCGKTILEADRNAAAREADYNAILGKLVPLRSSPMNDVLLGWPRPKGAYPYRDLSRDE